MFDPVVIPNTMLVVNFLVREQSAAKVSFHHHVVFPAIALVGPDTYVTSFRYVPATLPEWMILSAPR